MSNLATNRTVASCMANGTTNIPLRRTPSRNGPTSPPARSVLVEKVDPDRWKVRFDESESKRKSLLAQNEKNMRSYQELERKYTNLQAKNEELETELFEKNETLTKLTSVSKSLFKEYDMLKNKYEAETGAMHMALSDATHWYRENQMLRRRTLLLDKDSVDEGVDAGDNGDHDLENLRESLKQLSEEVARLQSELNSAKLLEFETSEQNVNLTQELEIERKKSNGMGMKMKELEKDNEQLLRVAKLLQKEISELRDSEQAQRDSASRLRQEADDFKKERNVLAHQSTVILQGLNSDNGLDHTLIFEIEDLKRTLEDERNRYNLEINTLQEKLDEQETNSHTEILEERLKLVESELQDALKRAEEAEKALKPSPPQPLIPPPPPTPLIPPPPPPPVDVLIPPTAPLRTKKAKNIIVPDTADSQGEADSCVSTRKPAIGGVNDDIINEIKCGKFTLRKRKNDVKKERETPKAVNEMLNILGSLRRTSKSKISLSTKFADVQL